MLSIENGPAAYTDESNFSDAGEPLFPSKATALLQNRMPLRKDYLASKRYY